MDLAAPRRQPGAGRLGGQGFTLIELLVAALVVGALVAIAVPTYLGARSRAHERAADASLRTALTAASTMPGFPAAATAVALSGEEPSLTFAPATVGSTGPRSVAIAADAVTWTAATRSAAGTCRFVSSRSGVVTYGTVATAGTCTPTTTLLPVTSGLGLWLAGDDLDGDGAPEGAGEDCDVATTCTATGGLISRWADRSGNARHASGSGTSRPTSGSGTPSFDGSNDALDADAAASLLAGDDQSFTTFVVVHPTAIGTTRRMILLGYRDGTSPLRYTTAVQIQTGPVAWRIGRRDDSGNEFIRRGGLPTVGQTAIVTSTYTGSSAAIAVNGIDLALTGSGSPDTGPTTLDRLRIGSGFGNEPFAGTIAEVLIYGRALDAAEQQDVERYLATKWGVTLP